VGDFNGQIGKDAISTVNNTIDKTNRNGNMLLNLCNNNLFPIYFLPPSYERAMDLAIIKSK
jgi:hypothetical protein